MKVTALIEISTMSTRNQGTKMEVAKCQTGHAADQKLMVKLKRA